MMNFSWVSEYVACQPGDIKYDVAFIGKVVDERGQHCKDIASGCSKSLYYVEYDPENFTISIGDIQWKAHQVDCISSKIVAKNILFDATTLDFPDILLILRGYLSSHEPVTFNFLYAEPGSYNSVSNAASRHEFALADGYATDHYPIPGFVALQKKANDVANVTVFVGFESNRLRNLIADTEGENRKRFNVIVGIPPFKTDWETHSLMQNATVFVNEQVDEILYAGANNPYSCYEALEMLYNSRATDSPFEVAPLGTKPATIAAALFAAGTRGVSVRYDYPTRSKGRSQGVGKLHLFTVWRD